MSTQDNKRSPVEPGQNRPVLAVIRRTLGRGGYTVHATSLQYLVDLVDDLTARAEKAEAERDALRTALDDLEEVGRKLLTESDEDELTEAWNALSAYCPPLPDISPSSAGGKSDG